MAKFKQSLQENLLTILCFSTKNANIVRNIVEPGKFDGIYQVIARHAIDYLDIYKKPPEKHIADLLEKELEESSPQAQDFKQLLTNIFTAKDTLNESFILTKLSTFLTIQAMREGIITVAQQLQDETEESVDNAEAILAKLRRTQVDFFDAGIWFGTKEALDFTTTPVESYATGIEPLDARHLGPTRKELHLFMALLGRGKTWWLIHLGKNALRQRARVCHITLEVSANIVIQRYYQSMFAIAKRETETQVATWETDDLGRIHTLGSRTYTPTTTLDHPDITKHLRTINERWGERLQSLVVKEFPTGQLSVSQLTAYLDLLYDETKFTPDVLLIDYVDLMSIDPNNHRIALGNLVIQLRGLAVERNMAVVTVSQSNRQGVHAKKLNESHIGEDFSKIQTADVVISYTQTDQEQKRGLARLDVMKARNEEGQFTTLIAQNYAAGQFCLQSHPLTGAKYWEELNPEKKKDEKELL